MRNAVSGGNRQVSVRAPRPQITLRAAPARTPLEGVLAAADDLRDLKPIALRAIRYAAEARSPNIKEPFSIANRRTDLFEQVRVYNAKRGIRRVA